MNAIWHSKHANLATPSLRLICHQEFDPPCKYDWESWYSFSQFLQVVSEDLSSLQGGTVDVTDTAAKKIPVANYVFEGLIGLIRHHFCLHHLIVPTLISTPFGVLNLQLTSFSRFSSIKGVTVKHY